MTTTQALKRTLDLGMDITILKPDGTPDFEGHITTCRKSGAQIVASGRHLRLAELAHLHDQGRLQVHHAGDRISIETGGLTEKELTPPAVIPEDFRILKLKQYSPSDLELLLDTVMLRYNQTGHLYEQATRDRLNVWLYRIRDAFRASKKNHN